MNFKDKNEDTPLHLAVNKGNFSIAQILINRGAEIDVRNKKNQTPLHLACQKSNINIFILLINCRASLYLRDQDGNTPLHILCKNKATKIIKWLRINHNLFSFLKISNNKSETPLDLAIENNILWIFTQRMKEEEEVEKKQKNFHALPCTFKKSSNDNKLKMLKGDSFNEIKDIDFLEENNKQIISTSNISDILNQNLLANTKEKKSTFRPVLRDFSLIKQIGQGSFGNVYLIKLINNSKKIFAMKVINKRRMISKNLIKYAFTERNILCSLKHPFIVSLHYAFQTDSKLILILDYCPNGDLGQVLLRQSKISEENAKKYLAEILLAIEELHKHDIIYRDLKPDNIVLDENGHAVLTDFGLSKEGINDNFGATSFCGSIAYLAPEMLKKSGHGKAIDWYLFGVLMYELIVGFPPYFNKSKEKLFENIQKGVLDLPITMSSDARSLIISVI